ncbi:MAG: sulfatase [Planctomycetota bacterium]|jgi:arylsulfatase A-like enzyme
MRELLIVSALALVTAHSSAASGGGGDRPNVVVILVDDLGFMDIGANNPATFYETPHVDALAASGVRFTSAYAACPVCSPTRASMLTGKYPPRVGITDYINPGRGNQPEKWRRKTPLLPAPFRTELAHDEVTLAEALREHGYATFFAGKWHLGSEGHFPEDQGFDVNKGGLERGGPYGGKKYFSPYGNARLADGPEGEHLPDRLARETVAFMRDHRDVPFLAYLSFYSVHTPLIGRPDLVEHYRRKQGTLEVRDDKAERRSERKRKTRLVQDHAVYAAMVTAMDEAVGTVLAGLDELGLTDETIVVFFSDNGGLSTSEGSPTSNEPYRAGKGWLYEGGIREPCIVRVPGLTVAGRVCDAAIISNDFFPTILELTGADATTKAHADGTSLVSLLSGAVTTLDRDALYWHYPHYGNQGFAPGGAMRAGNWKLIENYEDGSLELYDLSTDPGEATNLVQVLEERSTSMRDRLHDWRLAVGGVMPTQRATDPSASDGR